MALQLKVKRDVHCANPSLFDVQSVVLDRIADTLYLFYESIPGRVSFLKGVVCCVRKCVESILKSTGVACFVAAAI